MTPSCMVVSVPKSGTVFLNRLLSEGLGLRDMVVSNRYFPIDQLWLDAMPEFAGGGRIASVHIDASSVNIKLLRRYAPSWVVHLRDPRSVVLSWTHHIERLFTEGQLDQMLRVEPTPPFDYHAKPFAERLSWQIENFLPAAVSWTLNWLEVVDRRQDSILLTRYEELRHDATALAARIVDFFGIDRTAFAAPPLTKDMAVHFRRGDLDEWREALTAKQLAQANAMVPLALFERFGWPRQ